MKTIQRFFTSLFYGYCSKQTNDQGSAEMKGERANEMNNYRPIAPSNRNTLLLNAQSSFNVKYLWTY